MKCRGFFLLGLLLWTSVSLRSGQTLRILTINVWSGLDYKGIVRFGAYETTATRAARFQSLLSQIRDLAPDLIFLQEVNPGGRMASRLARNLAYTEIHQYCIAGIKIGPLGIPVNCREGNAILARRDLDLQKEADWKLSGSFGLFGGAVSIQVDQAIFAILGTINVGVRRIHLVNTHLVAVPPPDTGLERSWETLLDTGAIVPEEHRRGLARWRSDLRRQESELTRLAEKINRLPSDAAVIVAGDFNAPPESGGIARFRAATGLFDTFASPKEGRRFSWDPSDNANIRFSTSGIDAGQKRLRGYDRLCSVYDSVSRRIDYVFLNRRFHPGDVVSGRIVLDERRYGVQASDHYGVLADVRLDLMSGDGSPGEKQSIQPAKPRMKP